MESVSSSDSHGMAGYLPGNAKSLDHGPFAAHCRRQFSRGLCSIRSPSNLSPSARVIQALYPPRPPPELQLTDCTYVILSRYIDLGVFFE